MLKIKVPGEIKMMDVGYDAVVAYKNYYEEKGAQYRVLAYNDFLQALDKEKANGVIFDEDSFEAFVNAYMEMLVQARRDIRNQIRKEKDLEKKAELRERRKQKIKAFSYIGLFSKKHRLMRAAIATNPAIH